MHCSAGRGALRHSRATCSKLYAAGRRHREAPTFGCSIRNRYSARRLRRASTGYVSITCIADMLGTKPKDRDGPCSAGSAVAGCGQLETLGSNATTFRKQSLDCGREVRPSVRSLQIHSSMGCPSAGSPDVHPGRRGYAARRVSRRTSATEGENLPHRDPPGRCPLDLGGRLSPETDAGVGLHRRPKPQFRGATRGRRSRTDSRTCA
ncbi:hypothetical protein SAMN05444680_102492 [Variovorax sp. YR216]|nr:hypothetical protein SAMN05444680_102492 [Variovorax sp. YR216]